MSTPAHSPTRQHAGPPHDALLHEALLHERNSSGEATEGTAVAEGNYRRPSRDTMTSRHSKHLRVEPVSNLHGDHLSSLASPSQAREQAYRLDDELKMLQVERQVSQAANELDANSMKRTRSRRDEPVDEFVAATNPLHERTQIYKPPEHPAGNFSKIFKRIHESSFLVRYFFYIMPVFLILLIPLLIGAFVGNNDNVGGVSLLWFCIWLEIVWLTLWAGRILAKCLPYPIGLIASLFTNNSKKWRDMGKQLEIPATLFFWWLCIEVSFLPTMRNHDVDPVRVARGDHRPWQGTMNKVLVSFFVGFILNFVAKIIIQLIAISFHLRTYSDRIELNKFQIDSLVKLYQFSKLKIAMEDSDFEAPSGGGNQPGSGARTPGLIIEKAQKNTRVAFNKFGDVAGKIAGDFTGKQVVKSSHPSQVVLTLLATNSGGQVLARRLYRTFAREDTELIHQEDLTEAFENADEAEAAFTMFDKDMNGDITMEELEAVCVEIGRERKSITASLKDLDSVVSKLDDVFMFIVLIITILVFISLISTSAAGVLTSAGSTVLALSWLFSATAQEFLQSIIFVFVKHPFDVGDRVTVYGNTGNMLKGDDYFVKEIALLFTEFKKMEGHVVQAPNSYLNTLFILNHRRSGGLAEAVPMIFKFGTTLEQIDALRTRLLEFVKAEKREYQGNILTELRDVTEAHSITLNIIFFYKASWQNELLRLQRRNKFICALMVSMQELGIEGPRMRYPGQKESFPLYMQNLPFQPERSGHMGYPDNPAGDPVVVEQEDDYHEDRELSTDGRSESRVGGNSRRRRGESIAQMGRRLDFSLGMNAVQGSDIMGDVLDERQPLKIPKTVSESMSRSRAASAESRRPSQDIAHTTGRSDSFSIKQMRRAATAEGGRFGNSVHRNRFFSVGRRSHESERPRAPSMTDIPENGVPRTSESHRMESGMAGIPEEADGTVSRQGTQTLDPRTGLVSPQAVRADSTDTTTFPAMRSVESQEFEMQRL